VQSPASHERYRVQPDANAADLRKLILKLRWIGHDSEAEELCVRAGRTAPDLVSVEEPRVTD
jgi:hypothetical protein